MPRVIHRADLQHQILRKIHWHLIMNLIGLNCLLIIPQPSSTKIKNEIAKQIWERVSHNPCRINWSIKREILKH